MPISRSRAARGRAAPTVAAALLAALLVACTDPAGTAPLRDQARLQIAVRYLDVGESAWPTFGFSLAPNAVDTTITRTPSLVVDPPPHPRLNDRRPRPLSTDTVRIGTLALAPVVRNGRVSDYRAVVPLAQDRFASTTLRVERLPAIGALPIPGADSLVVGGVSRLDGDTVTVAAGSDLRLHVARGVATPKHPDPSVQPARWTLKLLRPVPPTPGTETLPTSINGIGLPPATIVVPASLLPAAGATVVARLTYDVVAINFTPAGVATDSSYVVYLGATTAIRWTVRVTGAVP